ncbi:MAG: serine hydrolase domain-containing protein, partial [Bdellovibrionota bacterium]
PVFGALPTITVKSYSEALDAFEKRGFSGTVLVGKKGEDAFIESRGFRDYFNLDAGLIKSTDRLLIGSNTKQFVAATILKLEEKGHLSTEDFLSKFLPDYPWSDRVTLAQLMNHTAGVPNYTDLTDIVALISNPVTNEEISAIFGSRELDFEPGSKWNYSNSGYFLLGQVIENITGRSWFEVLRDELLVPAGMLDTGYDTEYVAYDGLKGFDWNGRFELVPTKTRYLTWANAAGALYSTTHDLATWNRALHSGKVLSTASYEKMVKPGLEDYGFGLLHVFLSFGNQDVEIIGHSGGLPGFYSKNYVYPKQEFETIVLSNATNGEDRGVEAALRKISIFGEATVTPIPESVSTTPEFLEELKGRYAFKDFDAHAGFDLKNGELFFRIEEQEDDGSLVRVIGNDLLYLRFDDITMDVLRNTDATVTGFKLTQQGQEFIAEKE